MKPTLNPSEIVMMRSVFRRHPKVTAVQLFGSRAKGTNAERSDIDLALLGNVTPLEGQEVAAELDELPIPYKYDVLVFNLVRDDALRDHVLRVGISLYPGEEALGGATEIETYYKELLSGQRESWSTLRNIPREETRALVILGLIDTNGSYKEVAARFHVGPEEYRRFMDFLRRQNCLIDHRAFRKMQPR